MTRPFELALAELPGRLDEMVDTTFGDLQSQFLSLPRGSGFIEYADFQAAYETLKNHTLAFRRFEIASVWEALRQNAMTLVVLRTMLGMSAPEWAEVANSELQANIPQGAARGLDTRVRRDRTAFSRSAFDTSITGRRVHALVEIAVRLITDGAPAVPEGTVHRLAKVDTTDGVISLQNAADLHIPYAVLLYERYLGRPFASHRDSVSELVGEVMESAVEEALAQRHVTFRKTRRAERIAGFEQAPDFFIPTEFAPAVIIEAKITGDDGTARDKVARILRLASMRDDRERNERPTFEVIACIDGRGFGIRRQDMRDLLTATRGKVFTLSTLGQLIDNTRLAEFATPPA